MLFLSVEDVAKLLKSLGLKQFFPKVIEKLTSDFCRWDEFHKSPRHAVHYPHGVIELMPCADQQYYAFKYVNGHPGNPAQGKLSVFAFGVVTDVMSGYPLLLTEMTLLTAVRTAATAALAAKHLARKDSTKLTLIGTGAQSEFLAEAIACLFPLKQIHFYDIDNHAMEKFANNMGGKGFKLMPEISIADAAAQGDIVVTATAAKHKASLINPDMLQPGQCYLGLGGDCPGKTEMTPAVLDRCKIVVEYLPQSLIEGEIQDYDQLKVHGELWEVISGRKPGRDSDSEITLFDSVGFALEDYSILTLLYEMHVRGEISLGEQLSLAPMLKDPKNLYGVIT